MLSDKRYNFRLEIASEEALIAYCEKDTLPLNNQRVQLWVEQLQGLSPDWLVELVPAYQSLLIYFDPMRCDHQLVLSFLKQVFSQTDKFSSEHTVLDSNEIALPVFYAPPIEHDIGIIAKHSGYTQEQIIQIHQQQVYQVFCLGFAPGFAFLGEVDERIATPRLRSVRKQVPAGAVAIADRQTAVYPNISPGGWNIIGLCPTRLFDPKTTPCTPFQVGSKVRFYSIDERQYIELGGRL